MKFNYLFFTLFIGSIFLSIVGTTTEINDPGDDRTSLSVKTSASWDLYPICIDDSGTYGNGTWAWAITQPWCSGAGTIINPYVIENITIDGKNAENCLIIEESTDYFVIKNSKFFNAGDVAGAGIRLWDADNGIITGCNFSLNNDGIMIGSGSSNNTIINNNFTYNNNGIISLQNYYNNITQNLIENNYNGIYLRNFGAWYNISKNSINFNHYGIKLHESGEHTINDNNFTANVYCIYEDEDIDNYIFNNKCNNDDLYEDNEDINNAQILYLGDNSLKKYFSLMAFDDDWFKFYFPDSAYEVIVTLDDSSSALDMCIYDSSEQMLDCLSIGTSELSVKNEVFIYIKIFGGYNISYGLEISAHEKKAEDDDDDETLSIESYNFIIILSLLPLVIAYGIYKKRKINQ